MPQIFQIAYSAYSSKCFFFQENGLVTWCLNKFLMEIRLFCLALISSWLKLAPLLKFFIFGAFLKSLDVFSNASGISID